MAAADSPVPVITIDGPSGSGKGTIAMRVATALGWHLLDSGALYRLIGLAAFKKGLSFEAHAAIAELASTLDARFSVNSAGEEEIWLDGEEVTHEIRNEEAGRRASIVAAIPEVRAALIGLQRSFQKPPGLVADGRDMGTIVFPQAPLKVFLTASAEERAQRRHKQLKGKGIDVSLPALSRDIKERDRRDSERLVAPLKPAGDARLLDSSKKSIDEVAAIVLRWVAELKI